jgi:AsmA protein
VGSTKAVNLSDLQLKLDETSVKGSLAVADFAKPAIDFKLAVDAVDADRYLPPKIEAAKPGEAKKAAPKAAASNAASGDDSATVGSLRALNLRGSLSVGKLKINNAKLSNVSFNINAKNGDVRLAPLSADLYQGKYNGSVVIDAGGAAPKLTLDQNLSGVQVEPLLIDLNGASRISGTTELKAQLQATGVSADPIKRSLNGTAQFSFKDGSLKGVNLGYLVRKAEAGIVAPVEEKAQTDFSEVKGTLKFTQGVVSNEDLVMKSPLLRVDGSGKANLVSEQIDYLLKTTLTATGEGQGGKEGNELSGVMIPIKVSGTFAEPKYRPDLEGLAKAKAEKLIEKQKAKVTEKIKEKIGEGAGKEATDKLKDLLKF